MFRTKTCNNSSLCQVNVTGVQDCNCNKSCICKNIVFYLSNVSFILIQFDIIQILYKKYIFKKMFKSS